MCCSRIDLLLFCVVLLYLDALAHMSFSLFLQSPTFLFSSLQGWDWRST